nr:MAG TPA: Cas system-associated protein [Caudoviricetes sp.]
MANNLFITYDLNKSGKNYEGVFDAIKSLGNWAKYQKSAWYVNTNYTASQACALVWAKMDADDSLMVVDASHNVAAWQGLTSQVATHIQQNWNR